MAWMYPTFFVRDGHFVSQLLSLNINTSLLGLSLKAFSIIVSTPSTNTSSSSEIRQKSNEADCRAMFRLRDSPRLVESIQFATQASSLPSIGIVCLSSLSHWLTTVTLHFMFDRFIISSVWCMHDNKISNLSFIRINCWLLNKRL